VTIRGRASGEAARVIEQTISERVLPLLRRLIRVDVERGVLSEPDAEDLENELALRILRRLRQIEEQPRADRIDDLEEYVRATVRHALEDARRQRDPLRTRLASRIRYVVTHTKGLMLWGRGPSICGLAGWEGRPPVPVAAAAGLDAAAIDDPTKLRRAILDVLVRSRGPATLPELTDAIARAAGCETRPFLGEAELESRVVEPEAPARLEGLAYLQELWREISALPVRQRRALLLHLRIDDGESAVRVLAALGIVPIRALAEALEMPLPALLVLWNDLPLADERIAEQLGTARQQVINLRKSARDRLARRMERVR
jgi:hypothetical protein